MSTKCRELNQSVGWSWERINKLVCLYQKHKCLWKKDNSFYLDYEQRYNAYKNICKGLTTTKLPFVEVLMKIQEVRRLYIHELKRILYAQWNGYDYKPKFIWFWKLHQFLYSYLEYEETLELHVGSLILFENFNLI